MKTEEPNINTIRSKYSSAETCRRNGWQVGDMLTKQEDGITTIIRITAIGEVSVLANDGDSERAWCFMWNDWRKLCQK